MDNPSVPAIVLLGAIPLNPLRIQSPSRVSIRITLAPNSAINEPARGPAITVDKSKIVSPSKG